MSEVQHPSTLMGATTSRSFEHLVAAVEDYAIFTLDATGVIRSWNLGARRMKQYETEEILGRHFSIFYGEEDLATRLPERELVTASSEGSFADEGWRLRKDGTRFWASITITAIRTVDGALDGFLKISRDLTERRMAAERLRQSEERFRLLLENVEDYAIFMLDPEGHIISWNGGAKRIKGYDAEEILSRHFSIFYPQDAMEDGLPERLMAKALREGKVEDEGWRVRRDGSRFWAQVLISAVHDAKGELRGFSKITRDLTDRRRMGDLEELDRKKDAFLATLAHELRNPLAPLLTGLEMLRDSGGDEQAVRTLATRLEVQVSQMSRLVEDLLDMSRMRLGKVKLHLRPLPLSELLDAISTSIQPRIQEHRHRFILSRPSGDPVIRVDPVRINQVMANLLGNACKFTPEGGEIRLSAAWTETGGLKLEVTDNGLGISPEWQAGIFNLYDQVADGEGNGLGIGLTLVKDLVELHGGTISVHSAGEGHGSTFTVILPDAVITPAAPFSAPASTPEALPDPGRKRRILIADDGKNAAEILAMFFTKEGYEAAIAHDGQDAISTARTFLPDLIFMDLGMPRLNGFDAARILLSEMPGIPIVALSGWGAEEDRQRSAAAGFSDHLVKPVGPADLREILRKYLPI